MGARAAFAQVSPVSCQARGKKGLILTGQVESDVPHCHQTLVTGINSFNSRNQPMTRVLFYSRIRTGRPGKSPRGTQASGPTGCRPRPCAHSPGPYRPTTLPGEFRGGVSVRGAVMVGSCTKVMGILDECTLEPLKAPTNRRPKPSPHTHRKEPGAPGVCL